MAERPDWIDGAPVDAPAAAPMKTEGGIERPDWTPDKSTEPGSEVVLSTEAPVPSTEVAHEEPDIDIGDDEPAQEVAASDGIDTLDHATERMLDEWRDAGGIDHHLGVAKETAQEVIETLAVEDQETFVAGFDGLPGGSQTAIISELALTAGGSVKPVSDEAVERFGEHPEGDELLGEWGNRSAQNIAIVRARLNRMLSNMTPEDKAHTLGWFDELTPDEAYAVYRTLASR